MYLNKSARIRSGNNRALIFISDTLSHSDPERKPFHLLMFQDYPAKPLYQPVLAISLTVNHLDVALPVWLWIQANEGGGRSRKGN